MNYRVQIFNFENNISFLPAFIIRNPLMKMHTDLNNNHVAGHCLFLNIGPNYR